MSEAAAARRWIVSPAYDLAFFFGGAAASLAALGLYLAGVPILVLWWTWILAFDGPHIAAAFTRTYIDGEEWRRRRGFLLASLLAFAAGPLALVAGRIVDSPEPFQIFLGLAVLYAYHHVVRQHYGFLALYSTVERSSRLAFRIEKFGRPSEASQAYERLAGVSPWGKAQATSGMADLALHEGRLAHAAQILEKGVIEDQASGNDDAAAGKLALLARIQLDLGRRSQAVGSADRAVAAARGESVLFQAAQVYLGAGQPAKASRLATELGGRLGPEPQLYAKLLEGESVLGRDARAAVKSFQEAQKIADSWLGRFGLGRAYLHAGAFTEASSEFEECLRRRGEAVAVFLDDVPSYHLLDPVHYFLARAQEGLGSPGAADSYRLFLAPKAELSDDSLVADARRREKAPFAGTTQ